MNEHKISMELQFHCLGFLDNKVLVRFMVASKGCRKVVEATLSRAKVFNMASWGGERGRSELQLASRFCRRLETLKLRGSFEGEQAQAVVRQALEANAATLTDLDLASSRVPWAWILKLPALQRLDCSNMHTGHAMTAALAKACTQLTGIRASELAWFASELKLRRVSSFSPFEPQALAALPMQKSLTALYVSDVVRPPGASLPVTALSRLPALTELSCVTVGAPAPFPASTTPAVVYPELRTISLSLAQDRDYDVEVYYWPPFAAPKLTRMESSIAMDTFAGLLSRFPSVTRLRTEVCPVRFGGPSDIIVSTKLLGETGLAFRELQKLELRCLSSLGALATFAELRAFPAFMDLQLDTVGPSASAHLHALLRHLPLLTRLSVALRRHWCALDKPTPQGQLQHDSLLNLSLGFESAHDDDDEEQDGDDGINTDRPPSAAELKASAFLSQLLTSVALPNAKTVSLARWGRAPLQLSALCQACPGMESLDLISCIGASLAGVEPLPRLARIGAVACPQLSEAALRSVCGAPDPEVVSLG